MLKDSRQQTFESARAEIKYQRSRHSSGVTRRRGCGCAAGEEPVGADRADRSTPQQVRKPTQEGQSQQQQTTVWRWLQEADNCCALTECAKCEREVLGCDISEGTLYNVRSQCFEQLAPVKAQIKASVECAAVIHCDETGLRVNSKLWWRYVACTASLTYYLLLCPSQTGSGCD